MLTDYKFWYIRRDDKGFITEATVRFYEGDITTENEMNVDGITKAVTRYRRTKRLQKADLPHFTDKAIIKESSGTETIIYISDDFGQIKTDDELRLFLNKELKKDTQRSPILEQEILDINK